MPLIFKTGPSHHILMKPNWGRKFFSSTRPEIDISVSKLLDFETFANFLKVSVSVSENLVSEKKSRFRFRKTLVSEKSLGFGKFGLGKKSRFRKIWFRKKKSRFRFRKTLVSEKSLGFGKFGLRKEKIQITKTVLVVMSQIWNLVLIWTKALKWSQISPSSARKSQISFQKMLRSLGLGLGLETFAKFLRVSVSKKISLGKKVSVSVSEKFGLGKKSRFSVSENLVSEKKYRFRFQKYLVSEKSLGIGFSQNFGFDIQCKTCSMTLTTNLPLFSWNHFRGLAAAAPYCQC